MRMEDYCQKAQIFLNKEEESKYKMQNRTALFNLYKSTLSNAVKGSATEVVVPEEPKPEIKKESVSPHNKRYG
jgi:hypothetical protein